MAWAPVHDACVNHDPEALLRELESGVSPNLKEKYGAQGRSPLCLVLEHSRDPAVTASCVSVLLNAGASVTDSISDSEMGHMAPLHYAASRAFAEVVAMLLEAGAEVDSVDLGRTALHYAAAGGFFTTVLILLEALPDDADEAAALVLKKNTEGNTAIDMARRCEASGICAVLERYDQHANGEAAAERRGSGISVVGAVLKRQGSLTSLGSSGYL